MDIPTSVINKAQGLIELFDSNFIYLGLYKDQEAYKFVFPPDTCTGYPFVYLYDRKNEKVKEVTGFEALDIIDECRRKK